MLFTDSVFIGVDPTSSRKAFTYAALDRDLNLLALADGEMEDVTAFLAGQSSATVAVNSPSGVNRGLVHEKMKKDMLAPQRIRGAEMRLAEYQLREHGIVVSGTAASAALCTAWVQVGFKLYRKLEKLGFQKYPQKESEYQILETHPHAGYCLLAGKIPLAKPSLEGRLQRQLLLYECGVRIKDPMDFFEEITRYKMTQGIWPMDVLYLPEQLDALIAAYTAWLAANRANNILMIGDVKEGLMVLPGKELKEKY